MKNPTEQELLDAKDAALRLCEIASNAWSSFEKPMLYRLARLHFEEQVREYDAAIEESLRSWAVVADFVVSVIALELDTVTVLHEAQISGIYGATRVVNPLMQWAREISNNWHSSEVETVFDEDKEAFIEALTTCPQIDVSQLKIRIEREWAICQRLVDVPDQSPTQVEEAADDAEFRDGGIAEGDFLTPQYLQSKRWDITSVQCSRSFKDPNGFLKNRKRVGRSYAYKYSELLQLRESLTEKMD